MESLFLYLFTFIIGICGQLYTNTLQEPNTLNTVELQNTLNQNKSENENEFLKLPDEILYLICFQLLKENDCNQNEKSIRENLVSLSLAEKRFYYIISDIVFKNEEFQEHFKLTIDSWQRLKNCVTLYEPKRNSKFPPLVTSIYFKSDNEDKLQIKPGHIKTLGSLYTHVDSIIFMINIIISSENYDNFERSRKELQGINNICIPSSYPCKSITNSLSAFSRLKKIYADGSVILGSMRTTGIAGGGIWPHTEENCIPQQLFNEFRPSYFFPYQLCQLQELKFVFNSHSNFNKAQVMQLLLNFSELRVLALINAGLTLDDTEKLSEALFPISRTLQELDLRGSPEITNEFVEKIFPARPKFFSLRVLDLSETNIDHNFLSSIQSQLENLTQLKINNCKEMNLSILNKLKKFECITKNLELLDLSNNQKIHFYATDFNFLKRTLSELLKKCPKFKYLIIKNCKMDSYFKELLEASLDSNKKFSSSLEIVYK